MSRANWIPAPLWRPGAYAAQLSGPGALEQVANVAEALGRGADAARWRQEAARRHPAVHRAFYHPSQGVYADGDQIDLVMPLMAGVVPGGTTRSRVP